jgi:ABC-2 type transport system ATP-binding protein
MSPVIEIKNVTKMYGNAVGVKDISLDIEPGAIFGFLGPNGAGKTTTISMVVDLIRPTSGNINVFGLDSADNSLEIRKRIGYLAGDFALDRGLTGWEQLEYFGNLRGNFDKKYVRELAQRFDCNLNKKFKALSRGNKQKVGLISALMHKPELLILDEPTSGLDPLVQAEFNKVIRERQKEGKTTFMSSHILGEVQEICDRVAFIREGRLIDIKSMVDLAEGLPREV